MIVLLLLAAAAAAPLVARPDDLVAEATFLEDTLPPGGHDLNLSLGMSPAEDGGGVDAVPRLQIAWALGPRTGFTVDAGLAVGAARPALATPTASLKLLLRDAGPDRTALAASLDLIGTPDAWSHSEVGVGLGAARPLAGVTVRAAVWGMTDAGRWDPHAHAGVSAAVQAGVRVRLLAEAVADVRAHGGSLGVGPTVKIALSEATSLTGAVLFDVAGGAPAFSSALMQVGRAL
ncbi:hypothetical protein [Anaeromyxobacter oryzae]|uniref:hypothetical protein n=1 Tax=Anaeromyxobacter oryzae TaxID=2918170 RepID=UPI0020BDEDD9|nr:hypothetical protein [Anaeromyxobacter oryzae]